MWETIISGIILAGISLTLTFLSNIAVRKKVFQKKLAQIEQNSIKSGRQESNYFKKGLLYYHQKQYAKALTDFNQAIALNQAKGYHYYWLGITRLNLKQPEAALFDFLTAIQHNPGLLIKCKNAAGSYHPILYEKFESLLYYSSIVQPDKKPLSTPPAGNNLS